MKVSQIPYKRFTIEEGRAAFEEIKNLFESAQCAEDVLKARKLFLKYQEEAGTYVSLAFVRLDLDSSNEFYRKEAEYYNEISPLLGELELQYYEMLLNSPFRPELEKVINKRIFEKAEYARKAFSPAVIEECQKENALVTEYSKLMADMLFDWEGEKIPLSSLRGYLEDGDRDVRKKAADAIGSGLQNHQEELDTLFDRLVKIRTEIAKKLGYSSFTELGYYRMNRLDYNAQMVSTFRENVKNALVPVVAKLKENLAKELGIDQIRFYDDEIYSSGKAPKPILNPDEIFEAAQKMYDDMDPEIGNFMRFMRENEAFDVLSRKGKIGGGYCTSFPLYKQPFILANFNGSCGDVDVITHEFGHALAAYFVFKIGEPEIDVGGMETAECHSMSMEFLCWKNTEDFFGAMANGYRKKHLLSALSFIPYGVIVDEFQQNIYDHPELTPKQRNELYLKLEEKYRPYLSFEDIPYLSEGTRWQYQMHIYQSPFYYIDYCLAQTVSLWFLIKSRENYESALKEYLAFVKKGGQKPFPVLLKEANIPSPFEDGSLSTLAEKALEIAKTLE